MTKSSSSAARVAAAIALIVGVLAIAVVIGSSLGGGGESSGVHRSSHPAKRKAQARRATPAVYIVQTGDTLISIAHKTGVSVARIQNLNPGIDPQILISGEKLKLR